MTNSQTSTTAPVQNTCRCGCKENVGKRTAYRPGHDARHVSVLKRALEDSAASNDTHSADAQDRVQQEVYSIFGQLKSIALRQKLGRAVDNDKEGLYNSFGDMGVYVPYSENPSLGAGHTTEQASFEAAFPADAPKARKTPQDRKAPKGAPAVADEPWITHEPVETRTVPEPMWEETTQDETPREVKVGRWTYPARTVRREGDAIPAVERNTKRDGSGEWVPYSTY